MFEKRQRQHEKEMAEFDQTLKRLEQIVKERKVYRAQRDALAEALQKHGHDPKVVLREALEESQA